MQISIMVETNLATADMKSAPTPKDAQKITGCERKVISKPSKINEMLTKRIREGRKSRISAKPTRIHKEGRKSRISAKRTK